jgi:uncharacterized protein involved in exopolysaccharide biosynthesis
VDLTLTAERPTTLPTQALPVFSDGGVDLGGFFRLLWRAKWFVLAVTILSTGLAAYYVLTSPPVYTATMVVQTAGDRGGGGLGGALGQLSGLVGLAGAAEDREFSHYQAILHSVVVADRLQQKYGILQKLWGDQWDPVQKRWIEPTGRKHDFDAWWNELRRLPRWTPPSIYDLARMLEAGIKVKRSTIGASIYEISYKGSNRDFAISFLDTLHKESELVMREERRARSLEQAKFLRSRIETTPNVEYRLSLYSMLAEQDKTLMLLESNLPYASIMIDPPNAPLRPDEKSLQIFTFAGLIGGLALSTVLVLLYALARRSLREPAMPKAMAY